MLLAALYRRALLCLVHGTAARALSNQQVTVEIRAVNACELGLAANGRPPHVPYRQP